MAHSLAINSVARRSAVLCYCLVLSVFSSIAAQSHERFAFEKAEMGLPVRVTLYAENEESANSAALAAFSRISELNAIFSDYDSDSELSKLSESSGSGRTVTVSEELWNVLQFAQSVSKRSGGAFDITVGPVVNLWRVARRKRELPNPEKLTEALGRVGYQKVQMNPASRGVKLDGQRMRLDAGGIAKGYALEEGLKVLRRLGYGRAMVAGGGDMALGDPPPGQSGWTIEVAALDAGGAPQARRLSVSNRCISTSGDLFQRLEIDGRRYSHIVDPRTGLGLTDHSLVTVVAEHGIESDALSKVLAVMGPESGLPLLEEMQGVAAYVVRAPDGRVSEYFSKRWMLLEPNSQTP